MKDKLGIALDSELSKKIDEIVEQLKANKVSKSELIEAIVAAFLRSGVELERTAQELVTLQRSKKLEKKSDS
jgi:metal-responsive CopG/Arc/MetJ family transcriptional regulator